ncbi:DUF2189 domain-containing protein [Leucothrix mucor]|uniref:DUF2189 domain-containing protein n=1 Tax=Leucothrix mucor TaxID=45248 RepID=UPI0003B4AE09|nr:DUF2189 domain-containing protein [Leucothrix mucor]
MSNSNDESNLPIIAPSRTIGLDAPLRWLKLGWQDFRSIPRLSLSYGFVMLLIALLVAWVAWQAHSLVLAIALTGGFFFIGPALAIGLYSMSRQLESGITPTFMRGVREGRKNMSNELVLSLMFLIVFLLWARAASMVHIFFPSFGNATASDLSLFLGIGSAVGAIFAGVVFCVGAFSIPMLLDRKVDAVTVVLSSISAVLRNKVVMAAWGLVIVVSVLLGIALGFVGLAVTLPVIGHATWHAYQEVIDASAWERNPGVGEQ